MIKTIQAEVAVIGSGGAGMMAAIGACDKGADVVLLGKSGIGKGTCTSMAGGFIGTSSAQRSVQEHYQDTLDAGRGLNNDRLVKAVVDCARESIARLKEMGVPLLELPDGFMVDNRANAREVPGIPLVESMARLIKDRAIRSIEHFHCLDLVLERGKVAGVIGVGPAGEPIFVNAPSVVLATGGAAAVYLRHDNPAAAMGEGYAMALRAGCRLLDMEFVQFYPLGSGFRPGQGSRVERPATSAAALSKESGAPPGNLQGWCAAKRGCSKAWNWFPIWKASWKTSAPPATATACFTPGRARRF